MQVYRVCFTPGHEGREVYTYFSVRSYAEGKAKELRTAGHPATVRAFEVPVTCSGIIKVLRLLAGGTGYPAP